MAELNKRTIVPLEWVEHDLADLREPFQIANNLTVENLAGTLTPEHFSLWREVLSPKEKAGLPYINLAIVHKFFSPGHVGLEEADSKDICGRTFVTLRLVKPTRSRYAAIQYKLLPGGEINVFSFTHPYSLPVTTPDSEALNRVNKEDLLDLRRFLPSVASVFVDGPEHLRRAIHYFDIGYSSIPNPEIQFLTWVMGIEAAVVDRKVKYPNRRELIDRITSLVDANTSIYTGSPTGEYLNLPDLTIGDVLSDLLRLRNRLAHGRWFPEDWKPDVTRPALTGRSLSYPEMLLEAAPLILRKLILAQLKDTVHGV